MADSSTYTPETIQRRYAMAQALLADPKQPVRHWAQGLDELAKGALGGYQINKTENLERQSRADANSQIAAALGLPAPAPVANEPSGFEKIAALFQPNKPDAAPMDISAPSRAPAMRSNVTGLPPDMAAPTPPTDIPSRIVNAESGGNPTATNPNSSAAGAGQFINSTWLDTIKKANPQLAAGKSDTELLALRSNPALSKDMTAAYAASNGEHLKNNGLDVTPGSTYLAHFAGPAGATAILKADPSTPVGAIVGQQAVIANPFLKNMTAGDLRAWADKKMGGSPMAFAGQPTAANPLAQPPTPSIDGPSPLDNAPYPSGPVGAPQPPMQPIDGPSPLDTAQYPAGPVDAPSVPDNAVLPPNAQPIQAPTQPQEPPPGIMGSQGLSGGDAATSAAPPQPAPPSAAPAGLGNNPNAAKIAALLTNPWIDPSVKTQVLTQLNPSYGFQTTGDGTILRTNPKTGTVEPIYQSNKPTFVPNASHDQYGNPVGGFVDATNQSIKLIGPNGQPIQPQAPNSGASPAGVTGADGQPLTGDSFLKSLNDVGKAETVKGIAEGRIPYPSGFIMKTPYGQWLTQAVGQYEPGIDATKIGERATFNKQLGSAAPASVGGQKTLMGTSLGHLSEVAEAAADLNNSNGLGSADLGHIYNAASNRTTENSAKVNKLNETVDRFSGEVGKLYSGSSGGGVAERDQTRSRFGGNQTPAELAAGLEASRDLIKSKLAALENQQDQVFGPDYKRRIDFLGQNGRDALTKIDAAITKLKGNRPDTTTPPATQTAPQAQAEKTINGKTYYKFGPNPTDWTEK